MTTLTDDLIDALELSREALRVARSHLISHPGYSIRVAQCIKLAEREAVATLAKAERADTQRRPAMQDEART